MSGTENTTPLLAFHQKRGARLTAFAGYSLPLSFQDGGFLREHLHTRAAASLFDVSHMGQVRFHAGDYGSAAAALEAATPADLQNLAPGRARYTQVLNDQGGVVDDLIIARDGDALFAVFNGARKQAALAHLAPILAEWNCAADEIADCALVALQGPRAAEALAAIAPAAAGLRFMQAADLAVDGVPMRVFRGGYTGEDGFEIAPPAAAAEALCERLLENPAVRPAGLGARDSLRLEAGLPLWGHELSETISPVEAGLAFSIAKRRRAEGGFIGFATVRRHLASGPPRRLIGLRAEGKTPAREGAMLFASPESDAPVGIVTSGTFSPTLRAPIALALLNNGTADTADVLFAEVRGRRERFAVVKPPFVPHRYAR